MQKDQIIEKILATKNDVNEALIGASHCMQKLLVISKSLDDLTLLMAREPPAELSGGEYSSDDDAEPTEPEVVSPPTPIVIEQTSKQIPPPPKQPELVPQEKKRGVIDIVIEQTSKQIPPPPKQPELVPQEKKRGVIERILKRDKTEEEKKREAMIADLEKELESLKIPKRGKNAA